MHNIFGLFLLQILNKKDILENRTKTNVFAVSVASVVSIDATAGCTYRDRPSTLAGSCEMSLRIGTLPYHDSDGKMTLRLISGCV